MNGAERLLQVMGRMMQQVQDPADIVYGVVAGTWPLRINVGDIQIDENFIVSDPEVIITMKLGEEVRMLRTNNGQKFYILKVVDFSGEIGWSTWAWVPDVAIDGTITWSHIDSNAAPYPTQVKGLPGARGVKGLQGDKGPVGFKGADGDKGARGDQGPPGTVGEPGVKGPKGVAGANGAKGETGDQGVQGPSGDKGRGLPAEGLTNQVPVRTSNTNYDMHWEALTPGDMHTAEYDPLKTVAGYGSLTAWLAAEVPFVYDIKSRAVIQPVPAMKDGDLLLTYEFSDYSFTGELYTADEIGAL